MKTETEIENNPLNKKAFDRFKKEAGGCFEIYGINLSLYHTPEFDFSETGYCNIIWHHKTKQCRLQLCGILSEDTGEILQCEALLN